MNKFLKKILDKFNNKLKIEIERQKKFFKKPDVLIALGIAALALLNNLVKEKKSKKEIDDFIRKDKASKLILSETANDLDEDSLSELLLKCLNGEDLGFPELADEMSAEDYLNFADKTSDLDSKINSKKFARLADQIGKNSEMLLTYTFLLQYIIMMVIDLFKTEHPGKYRTKYIQKLLRNVYGLMKTQDEGLKKKGKEETLALKEGAKKTVNDTQDKLKNQYEKIMSALKQIDNVLIAMTLATSIYMLNRVKLQKRSRESLRELSSGLACTNFADPGDVSVNKLPFEIKLDCPVSLDDELVPHAPIEEKLKALSCEIPQNDEIPPEGDIRPDLVTMAVIRNTKKDTFGIQVNMDSFVTQDKQVGKIGSLQIFGPTTGYVDKISPNELVLRDILDPEEDYLAQQIELLGKKYERLNNVKSFLKTYYTESLYPQMLSIATVDDASTYDINSGIEKQWKDSKKAYDKINEEYDKQVKKITGKDNVEKHAKNETLNEIQTELEKQVDVFYKNLKLVGESAENVSKKTKAKSNEYELFEYYAFNLGAMLNGVENPSDIEITFRDQINEYIRRRLVIDEYKKKKLENKLNDLIKDLEKGISVGNWFDKMMDVYKPKKSIKDVKNWLTGIADKNKKVEATEKTTAVNRIMFVFDLYLNFDDLVKKYNVLKKESTPKKETVKEGGEILLFMKNLWIEYDTLPKNINDIQAIIDSLALFQTYSIIDYEGKQARLYTISDEPECTPDDEDYKPSKAGYGDMRYWLKYCAYATLASVTNPALGWSTGWIFPAPILFPVIYVPIKAITTKYGFIVVGLSICGIWIFPWVLLANLSANHVTPFGDPTGALKREIQALKKAIMDQLVNMRKDIVKKMMDQTKAEIDKKEEEIKSIKNSIKENKDTKPSRYEANGNKRKDTIYLKEFAAWNEEKLTLEESLVTAKTQKWTLTKKWKILNEAYKVGKSVKGSGKAIEQTEEMINKQFDKLEAMVDKLDDIIAPLPITMKPNTANFGITLKNTKPIIKIAADLDDNINEGPLTKVTDKFKLNNADMMSTKYGSKLSTSIINTKAYKAALAAINLTVVQKDPFPKYERLTPVNVPWIAFLYKDFVKVGAQTYGFPDQMPVPIG